MWPPESAIQLEAFVANTTPEETHHIDFKRVLNTGRRDVAEHLASFATDGGWLVVGVDEPEEGLFVTAPIPLGGEPERIEGIAHTRVDPPLYIESTSLDKGDGTGYLLVRVPPSPHVVHAVAHAYWGRGDKRKIRLEDAEIDRRMRLRQSRFQTVAEYAAQRMAHYPEPASPVTRMFVRVTPRTPQPKPLWSLTTPGREESVYAVFNQAENACRDAFLGGRAAGTRRPWLAGNLHHHWPRPGGRALASQQIDPRGMIAEGADSTTSHAEVRILESGAVELWWAKPHAPSDARPEQITVRHATDQDVVETSALAIALAAAVAKEWEFDGLWDLAVYIHEPHGVGALTTHRSPNDPSTYPGREVYEETASFTTHRAREHLGDLTGLVIGSFLRSLHTYGRFFH